MLKKKETFDILRFIENAVRMQEHYLYKLSFRNVMYTSDGVTCTIDNGIDQYQLHLNPVRDKKDRPIPLTFDDIPEEA